VETLLLFVADFAIFNARIVSSALQTGAELTTSPSKGL